MYIYTYRYITRDDGGDAARSRMTWWRRNKVIGGLSASGPASSTPAKW